jgi:CubicO group peptidase (beta-lactamase class C family)
MRLPHPSIRRSLSIALTSALLVGLPALLLAQQASKRVPSEQWMRYADASEAGFDTAKLDAARAEWEALPSSAFLIVSDGAIVDAWGDVGRRFMCHSVRKSFLSGLYGIYWDRGEIELNKTLADLGLDDEPDPLLESEKQARILDLLKARSGVFHPAAYAGRTDSRPRGSEGPGRYFAYNNWDFNTLAAILTRETGDDTFEAFDRYFGRPLQMEDWRLSDGYYHYERDKSKYPAYPFRMSARDAARFGLLFARNGLWGDERILSRHWVRRSSALYSIDGDRDTANMGYGFMWWVFLDPRFEKYGAYAALGVGNQMIAVFPELDIVMVNRADTYVGEGTPPAELQDLMARVLDARVGDPAERPRLEPLEVDTDPGATSVPAARLEEFVGEFAMPPAPLGLPAWTSVSLRAGDGHLVKTSPVSGTFELYLQSDGSLVEEDSYRRFFPIRDSGGRVAGIADRESVALAAVVAASDDDRSKADALMVVLEDEGHIQVPVAGAAIDLLSGDAAAAEAGIRRLASEVDPRRVEAEVNAIGYALLQSDRTEQARDLFALNTRVFPQAFNTWDSYGESLAELGELDAAIMAYERSLELNPENENAAAMIARIRDLEP